MRGECREDGFTGGQRAEKVDAIVEYQRLLLQARAQRAVADALLRATGSVEWVDDENLMDAVTAVSGSGPAYFFYVVEAMADALRLFGIGASWGGYESLALTYPQGVHGWKGGALIRLHVGLEDPADLIADLARGLAAADR